jgi:hypothetical protein
MEEKGGKAIKIGSHEKRKTPYECRVRAIFLNLMNQVGTPKAL